MAARGGGRWRQRPEFTIPGWNEAQNMRRGARLCKRLASALANKTCRYDMNMTAARSWVKGFAHIHELALRISKPSAAGGCFLHESARILQSSPVCERCGADYSAGRGRCKYAKLLVGGGAATNGSTQRVEVKRAITCAAALHHTEKPVHEMKMTKMICCELLLEAAAGEGVVSKRRQHLTRIAKKKMKREVELQERVHKLKEASHAVSCPTLRSHLIHGSERLKIAFQAHDAAGSDAADAAGSFVSLTNASACQDNCSARTAQHLRNSKPGERVSCTRARVAFRLTDPTPELPPVTTAIRPERRAPFLVELQLGAGSVLNRPNGQ